MRHMLRVRKEHPALGRGDMNWVAAGDDRIAAYRRQYGNNRIVAVHNLSDSPVAFSTSIDEPAPFSDLLTGRLYPPAGKTISLSLAPYEYMWLKAD
jgi:glycosidase